MTNNDINIPVRTVNQIGAVSYRLNGKLHREDGPAYIEHFYRSWYINGKRHRLDGPAVEFDKLYKQWWINDVEYTKEEFEVIIQCPWMIE
jgi:hypothetical protein